MQQLEKTPLTCKTTETEAAVLEMVFFGICVSPQVSIHLAAKGRQQQRMQKMFFFAFHIFEKALGL